MMLRPWMVNNSIAAEYEMVMDDQVVLEAIWTTEKKKPKYIDSGLVIETAF